MTKLDPHIVSHLEWLGFVRPTGLVVSAPALVRAGAILDSKDIEGQRLLRACTQERVFDPTEGLSPYLPDFEAFAGSVLRWSFSPKGYAGTPDSPIPQELEVALPDYGETLRPDFAVRELEPQDDGSPWQLLARVLDPGNDFDRVVRGHGRLEASEHGRLERLLRQTRVPAGLLFNGRVLRLISAPYGESSGWVDFRVADMVQTAGRPISSALRLLLGQSRLLSLPRAQRLPALLHDSRKFQNEVSERLAEQVLHALYEFVRGFQAAHDASGGELLRQPLAEQPDEVYHALLTVVLRLVFLLYAEERDMLPQDDTFLQNYSLAGLYERLREDAALYPDTMDQRYGAWAQLLVLFRIVHDGADAGTMRLPRRHGALFDPDRFPFLEGRGGAGARQLHEPISPPLVPDGTIHRAFEKLFVLDGERISYRALDVEQIGSVYETMMGFRLERATGLSVAIRSQKKQGAPTSVDLDALLQQPAAKRDEWFQKQTDRQITDMVKRGLRSAQSVQDLHAVLLPILDLAATPDLVPRGGMVLQPSEERRRSSSHYTPRELTEPTVRATLDPILADLRRGSGHAPRSEQLLNLKLCDPAMGSGAFLVEACRQLGDALVEAWHAHGDVPTIPPDEDEVVFARRLVAQRCLYGVDRNPVAVDLAKVSIWLVTLARDHALTFVDHALRHGDSLVGLSRRQIEALQWDATGAVIKGLGVRERVDRVFELRQRIREAGDDISEWEVRDLWDEVQSELFSVRLFGDLVLAAFFQGASARDREHKRSQYAESILSGDAERYRDWISEWRAAKQPLAPFHWELEFPEVFERDNPGFDVFIGNPPFAHKNDIIAVGGPSYIPYAQSRFPDLHGYSDLCTYFIRHCDALTRYGGCWTLICTNTVTEGKSRQSGLEAVGHGGSTIIAARTNIPWPGAASVIVCAPTVVRGTWAKPRVLNGREVASISSSLDAAEARDVAVLQSNRPLSSTGFLTYGRGFVLDHAIGAQMLAANPRNAEVIAPLLTGDDLADSPLLAPSRFVINFGTRSLEEAATYGEPFQWIDTRVRPERMKATREDARKYWWRLVGRAERVYAEADRLGLKEVVVNLHLGKHHAFARVGRDVAPEKDVNVFAVSGGSGFAVLQSRVHEIWADREASSLESRRRYTTTTCFNTFPFP